MSGDFEAEFRTIYSTENHPSSKGTFAVFKANRNIHILKNSGDKLDTSE
jgi:hypothetical protein